MVQHQGAESLNGLLQVVPLLFMIIYSALVQQNLPVCALNTCRTDQESAAGWTFVAAQLPVNNAAIAGFAKRQGVLGLPRKGQSGYPRKCQLDVGRTVP